MTPQFTLVSHALCPYVQRAAIALTEKGVPFSRNDIDLAHKPAWFLAVSPHGKTPVLLVALGDERVPLFEPTAIGEYLDETLPPRLHPEDPLQRARHRAWIEAATATLHTIWLYHTAPDVATFERRTLELAKRFEQIEAALGAGPWFAGDSFSLVDAAFAPVFRYFDVFDTIVDSGVFARTPRVRAWRSALAQRPSVAAAVTTEYPQLLRALVERQGGNLARLLAEPAPRTAPRNPLET